MENTVAEDFTSVTDPPECNGATDTTPSRGKIKAVFIEGDSDDSDDCDDDDEVIGGPGRNGLWLQT